MGFSEPGLILRDEVTDAQDQGLQSIGFRASEKLFERFYKSSLQVLYKVYKGTMMVQ